MTMSDRIAVMNKGHFEQVGAPEHTYELPATEFVASFLGASNLLAGEIEGANGDVAKVRLKAGATVSLPSQRLPASSGHVRVGVRPEKLDIREIGDGAISAADNAIDATVQLSTYTGVATTYECITQDGARVVVYMQNLGARKAPGAQTRVRLSWHPEHTFAVPVA